MCILSIQSWDDVERKLKPKEKPYNYHVTRPLDQDRSNKSLAQVYEEEYLKEMVTKEIKEGEGEGEEVCENEKHVEIRKAMQSLFAKLDALSNFHFTPKPVSGLCVYMSARMCVCVRACVCVYVCVNVSVNECTCV